MRAGTVRQSCRLFTLFLATIYAEVMRFEDYQGAEATVKRIFTDKAHWTSIDGERLSLFTNLEELILVNTAITALPHQIGQLQKLRSINLNGSRLQSLPKELAQLKALKSLSLYGSELGKLQPWFKEMQSLKILDLGHTGLTNFPAVILSLKNLEILSLNNNNIGVIPPEISKLRNLLDPRLMNTGIKELPSGIWKMSQLQFLCLSSNPLMQLPKKIRKLKTLRKLFVGNIGLQVFPKECCELTELEELDISKNYITVIPTEIEKLEKLKILNLSKNKLKEIPKNISKLGLLELFFLDSNELDLLPYEMGTLPKLRKLDLNSNDIRVLPSSFTNYLKHLAHLDLTNNPLYSEDVNGWLGRKSLRDLFKSRLAVSFGPKSNIEKVCVSGFYSKFKGRFHWNFGKLATLRRREIPKHKMSKEQALNIWDSTLKPIYKKSSEGQEFREYLEGLYDESKAKGQDRARGIYVEQSLDLSEAILQKLAAIVGSKGKSEKDKEQIITSNLNSICESLKYCTSRRIDELYFAYDVLYEEIVPENLELQKFVENFVANEKERIFNAVFTDPTDPQNVHTLNTMKYALRHELGFDFNFIDSIYKGHVGNALEYFFEVFTPEAIFQSLADAINKNQKILTKAIQYIHGSEHIPRSWKLDMVIGEDLNTAMISAVTEYFARKILIDLRILVYD